MALESSVQIAYDGPAVADGTMEIREIAPALQAIGDMIYEANARLNGDAAAVSIRISSEFRGGSFETWLAVHQVLNAGRDLLLGEGVKAADNLVKLLGLAKGAKTGLLQLVKKFKGQTPQKEMLPDGGIKYYISHSNVEIIEVVSPDVSALFEDAPVRRACRGMLRPLERKGIDSFQVRDGNEVVESVVKDELEYFEPPKETVVQETTQDAEALLIIETAAFRDTLSWRFSDGSHSFSAKISDTEFLETVASGRAFSRGHALKVLMKVTQHLGSSGSLSTEREILKVIEDIPQPRQGRLKY